MSEELARQWFCSIKGTEIGPISARQLSLLASTGKLESSDLVRRGDLEKWSLAAKVRGLTFLATTDGPSSHDDIAHVEEQKISTNQVVSASTELIQVAAKHEPEVLSSESLPVRGNNTEQVMPLASSDMGTAFKTEALPKLRASAFRVKAFWDSLTQKQKRWSIGGLIVFLLLWSSWGARRGDRDATVMAWNAIQQTTYEARNVLGSKKFEYCSLAYSRIPMAGVDVELVSHIQSMVVEFKEASGVLRQLESEIAQLDANTAALSNFTGGLSTLANSQQEANGFNFFMGLAASGSRSAAMNSISGKYKAKLEAVGARLESLIGYEPTLAQRLTSRYQVPFIDAR